MAEAKILEDFNIAPVPDADTMPGHKIAIVILAIGFTLPVLALGAQTASNQGLLGAAFVSVLSCGLAGALAVATSVIGARLRLSTYMILTLTFGRVGGRLINLLLAVMLLGWFANVADMLGLAVSDALAHQYHIGLPPLVATGLALVAMTLSAIFGLRIMERFAAVMAPLLCAFMIWIAVMALRSGTGSALLNAGDHSTTFQHAVSAVFGAVILSAVLAPDFTRYARDDRAAIISVTAIAIGFPLIMLLAAVPAVLLHEPDVMKTMVVLADPGVALTILVLATWTSNTGNLYSSTLTLATVAPRAPNWALGVFGAVVAFAAAALHISAYFVPFLMGLGVAATPIAGVYVANFFILRRWHAPHDRPTNFDVRNILAWLGATSVGYLSVLRDGLITPIPALDAILIAFVLHLILHAGGIVAAWTPRSPAVKSTVHRP